MVGKICVDSAIASRKEHFERKGQPPAAVKAKESTMDGVFKCIGMALGMYQLYKQAPIVFKEAQKFL